MSNINSYFEAILNELKKEITLFKKYRLKSIYIGGGSPSVVDIQLYESFFSSINNILDISSVEEFTFELNPDNVSEDYIAFLKSIGVNRISMGVQCLDDTVLKTINRRHNSFKAISSVNILKNYFSNISLDYIIGLPNQTIDIVEHDIKQLIDLGATHISSYSLSVEPNTILEKQLKKNILKLPCEEEVIAQYNLINKILKDNGWLHYEISNYSMNSNYVGLHNSSYWNKVAYLGLGAGASSYDGKNLRWKNVENLKGYINSKVSGVYLRENEILTDDDLFNEYVMLRLRTNIGIDIDYLKSKFLQKYQTIFFDKCQSKICNGLLKRTGNYIFIPEDKMMLYNVIVSDLFV